MKYWTEEKINSAKYRQLVKEKRKIIGKTFIDVWYTGIKPVKAIIIIKIYLIIFQPNLKATT